MLQKWATWKIFINTIIDKNFFKLQTPFFIDNKHDDKLLILRNLVISWTDVANVEIQDLSAIRVAALLKQYLNILFLILFYLY